MDVHTIQHAFLFGIFAIMTASLAIFGDSRIVTLLLGIVMIIYVLIVFIPSLAVTVRRLHDTGKSGWYILLNLIPYVGGLIIFIFTVMDSEPGENKWGPNPKEDYLYESEIDEIGMKDEY